MAQTVKVTKMKAADLVGQPVPTQDGGNVGRYVEQQLADRGYQLNTGDGVDIPALGVEIKSRKSGSNSAHTVAAMSVEYIINTPYHASRVCEKMQQQFRVDYSCDDNTVTDNAVYDFSFPMIQQALCEAWEANRQHIIAISLTSSPTYPNYVRESRWGILEKQPGKDAYYQFRIPHAAMKKILGMSLVGNQFSKMFETE